MKNRLTNLMQYWGVWLGSNGAVSLILIPLSAFLSLEFADALRSANKMGATIPVWLVAAFVYSAIAPIFAHVFFRTPLLRLVLMFFAFNVVANGFAAFSHHLWAKAGRSATGMQYFWDVAKWYFYSSGVGLLFGALVCLLLATVVFKEPAKPSANAPVSRIEGRFEKVARRLGPIFWVFCLYGIAQLWQPLMRMTALLLADASYGSPYRYLSAAFWAALVMQIFTMGFWGYLVPQHRRGVALPVFVTVGLLYLWINAWTQFSQLLSSPVFGAKVNWDLELKFFFSPAIVASWLTTIAAPLLAFWFFQRPKPQSPVSTIPNPLAQRNREIS